MITRRGFIGAIAAAVSTRFAPPAPATIQWRHLGASITFRKRYTDLDRSVDEKIKAFQAEFVRELSRDLLNGVK